MDLSKEANPLDERKEIIQDVIDRHIQYNAKYVKALKKLNEKFPTNVTEKDCSLGGKMKIRSYEKG